MYTGITEMRLVTYQSLHLTSTRVPHSNTLVSARYVDKILRYTGKHSTNFSSSKMSLRVPVTPFK